MKKSIPLLFLFFSSIPVFAQSTGVLSPLNLADGKETQRVGIIPDLEVKPTIKGIRENRDELMEKAIELISGP